MTRYHLINGERVAFTADEETARDAEETAAIAEIAATRYKENRICGIGTTVSGYGSIGEQLDKLYHDINNGTLDETGEFFTALKTVKDDNPKPSE